MGVTTMTTTTATVRAKRREGKGDRDMTRYCTHNAKKKKTKKSGEVEVAGSRSSLALVTGGQQRAIESLEEEEENK